MKYLSKKKITKSIALNILTNIKSKKVLKSEQMNYVELSIEIKTKTNCKQLYGTLWNLAHMFFL